ncbi:sulfurtransferase TusA family protein, partial [Anaerosalibacter bizertensis]|nr:sulfurtransferase TusA family protein [Anaerosalibacter bizertensis]
YKGTQGTSVAKVFDMTVASTGNNEKTLNKLGKEYGKDYLISFIHAKSHAGYYPEALPITIKLIFDLEGKILGAQSVGYDGVDKRIDVIATAIRFGGTIYDLKELELAYAPPYSSAKDPVNMAGYVAENILNKDVDTIFWNELDDLDRENSIILDVTDPEEREMGYVEGSINIPLNDLRDRLDELDKDKLIVPYCGIGIRGYIASRILVQNGFKAKNFAGGFMTYGNLFCKDENDCGGRIQSENIEYTDHGEIKVIGNEDDSRKTLKINISELTCPTPSKEINETIEKIDDGDILEILSSDPNFSERMKTWCSNTRNTFVKGERVDKGFLVTVKKGLNK